MQKNHAVMFLVLFVLLIYWLINYNHNMVYNSEYFSILKRIQNHTDNNISDKSHYHHHHHHSQWAHPTYKKNKSKYVKKKIEQKDIINKDSFIEFHGNKIRKELVPSNYINYIYMNAISASAEKSIINVPQAYNYYF